MFFFIILAPDDVYSTYLSKVLTMSQSGLRLDKLHVKENVCLLRTNEQIWLKLGK